MFPRSATASRPSWRPTKATSSYSLSALRGARLLNYFLDFFTSMRSPDVLARPE